MFESVLYPPAILRPEMAVPTLSAGSFCCFSKKNPCAQNIFVLGGGILGGRGRGGVGGGSVNCIFMGLITVRAEIITELILERVGPVIQRFFPPLHIHSGAISFQLLNRTENLRKKGKSLEKINKFNREVSPKSVPCRGSINLSWATRSKSTMGSTFSTAPGIWKYLPSTVAALFSKMALTGQRIAVVDMVLLVFPASLYLPWGSMAPEPEIRSDDFFCSLAGGGRFLICRNSYRPPNSQIIKMTRKVTHFSHLRQNDPLRARTRLKRDVWGLETTQKVWSHFWALKESFCPRWEKSL